MIFQIISAFVGGIGVGIWIYSALIGFKIRQLKQEVKRFFAEQQKKDDDFFAEQRRRIDDLAEWSIRSHEKTRRALGLPPRDVS